MKNIKNFLDKIIEGDAIKVLKKIPPNSVDLGLTSPPYNKQEKNKGWLVKEVKYKKHKDNLDEETYQKNQIEVLNEIFRIIKEGGSFFYNHKIRWDKGNLLHPYNWLKKTFWCIRQEIIWNRQIAGNIRGWRFWQIEERIYWLYKPIKKNKIGKELESRHALLTSIWNIRPEINNPHPAPFPVEIPTRIIFSILGEKKGIVIDPYMGSGTTAVVSKYLNKNFIGIENCQEYINFSENRIKNYICEKEKISKEINLHKVEKTFKDRKKERKNYDNNSTIIDWLTQKKISEKVKN